MKSKEDIVNLALLKIGVAPVSLDDPESEVARAANAAFEPSKTKLLRLHNWHFALKSADLQELFEGTRPRPGLSHRLSHFGPQVFEDHTSFSHQRLKFALPNDLIKIEAITHPYRIPYEIEGPYLICNARRIRIRYVANIDNPNLFDPLFIDCLSHLIGAQMAYMVAGAESKGQALKQEFELLLRDAKRIDSQETHNKPFINSDDLFLARLTGGYTEGF